MHLDHPVPQFLPMFGKKVRVNHRVQQILCTNCYGKHRKACKSEKLAWMDYVEHFMCMNENIANSMIVRWLEIMNKESRVPWNKGLREELWSAKQDVLQSHINQGAHCESTKPLNKHTQN